MISRSYREFVRAGLTIGKVCHIKPKEDQYDGNYTFVINEIKTSKNLNSLPLSEIETLYLFWEHQIVHESVMWGSTNKEIYVVEENDILNDFLTEIVPFIPMLIHRKLLKEVPIKTSERTEHEYGSRSTFKGHYVRLYDIFTFLCNNEIIQPLEELIPDGV